MTSANFPARFIRVAAQKQLDLDRDTQAARAEIPKLKVLRDMANALIASCSNDKVFVEVSLDDFAALNEASNLLVEERNAELEQIDISPGLHPRKAGRAREW